jgi:hypothetical protein
MKQLMTVAMLSMLVQAPMAKPVGEFAIANRGGSVTFLDYKQTNSDLQVAGDLLTTSVDEPMYITPLGNSKGQRMLAFADRTQNMLSILDGKTKKLLSQVELSKGAFHQFSHPIVGLRVAVATDVEKGMDLIQVSDNGKKLTKRHFSIPSTLTSGNPHDVVMDRKNVYLTVKGVQGTNGKFDVLLQIDVKTLKLVNAKRFSEDIHLFSPVRAGFFTVVEEETGDLHLLQKGTMKTLAKLNVAEGIHGISGSENGRFLFIADINEPAGSKAIHAVEVTRQGVKHLNSVSLNYPVAHNVAVDDRGETFKIVITHSGGAATQNSILSFSKRTKKLKFEKDVRTGPNPFGLTFF